MPGLVQRLCWYGLIQSYVLEPEYHIAAVQMALQYDEMDLVMSLMKVPGRTSGQQREQHIVAE